MQLYGDQYQQRGHDLLQLDNGDYVVLGTSEKPGKNMDILLIKLNWQGDTIWEQSYGGVFRDYASSLILTMDGGFLICGSIGINSTTDQDIVLIKTDGHGNQEWLEYYGFPTWEYGYDVVATPDSGYIFCGQTHGPTNGSDIDVFVVKVDNKGDTIWTKTIGTPSVEVGLSIIQSRDNNYVICGTIAEPQLSTQDVYLIKIGTGGDTVWTRRIIANNISIGFSVKETPDLGFIVTGWHNQNNGGLLLIKTDSLGNMQWNKTLGDQDEAQGNDVIVSSDGGVVAVGYNSYNVYLVKTDQSGTIIWAHEYGTQPRSENGASLIEASDGGFVITGTSQYNGIGDILVIKTDSYGNLRSEELGNNDSSKQREVIQMIRIDGRPIKNLEDYLPYLLIYDDGSIEKVIKSR
jgi:hypothetical protein